MIKLNFGCGSNWLDGWQNFDIEMDIRKALPFQSNSIHFILAEHCMEHTTHKESWNFLSECLRILAPGGVARIAVPDVTRIWDDASDEYIKAVKDGGHGDGTRESCVKAAIFSHGHDSVWSESALMTFMEAIGFKRVIGHRYGESDFPALNQIEGHHKVVGFDNAWLETAVVEGVKS